MGCLALFFLVWIGGWTVACIVWTRRYLLAEQGVDLGGLLCVSFYWFADFCVISHTIWYFRAATEFRFDVEKLEVEKSFWWFRRKNVFRRDQIKTIKQVIELDSEGSNETWGVVIITHEETKVMTGQWIEKTNWLGPIISEWVGVSFEQLDTKKK